MDLYLRLNHAFQNGKFGLQAAKNLSTKRRKDKGEINGAYGTVVVIGRDT